MAENSNEWSTPAAMALPKEGYFKVENGRYGPMYPKTPANYGFTVIVKVKRGREEAIREYGKTIEAAVKGAPDAIAEIPDPMQGSRLSMKEFLMLELADIQHHLLARPNDINAQYNFICFRHAAAGRKSVDPLLPPVRTAKSVLAAMPDDLGWV